MSEMKPPPSVSRRCLLRQAALGAGAAMIAAGMLPREAAAAKMSQKAAAYQDAPKAGQRCDGCMLFQSPGGCKMVDGSISPEGWCKLYAPKPAG